MPVDGISERQIAETTLKNVSERQRLGRSRPNDEQLLAETYRRLERTAIPEAASHVYEWFLELHGERQSSGYGPQPISSPQILAWCQLTGRELQPWEARAIRKLDMAWRAVWADARRLEGITQGQAQKPKSDQPAVIGNR